MVADVQDWVSNPINNYGWILICELEELEKSVRKFASREALTVTNCPSLEVQFTTHAVSPTLTVLSQTNGQFQFLFNAESNRNYSVLFADGIDSTNWVVLTNISALPGAAILEISDPIVVETNRYFRVRTP
jgi:hypothetical protein